MRRNTSDSRRFFFRHCGGLAAALFLGPAHAEIYTLTPDGGDLIGRVLPVLPERDDTLIDIARRYSVGQDEIIMANPTVDRWLPKPGIPVQVPRQYLLPDAPRAGIVVNIPEMRLYYFPVQSSPVKKPPAPKPVPVKTVADAKGKAAPPPPPAPVPIPVPAPAADLGEPATKAAEVITYPVSMGRMDWRTPLGKAHILAKIKDPTWTPPESIRREHAAKGDILPSVVPAGPDNPLGRFAMRLSVPGYLIHGTDQDKSSGIGMRVTHGCMRMYNEDIAKLFPLVGVNTPVYLVNQPVKLGWQGGRLYMEVSQPLDEDAGIPTEWSDDALADSGWSEAQIKSAKARKEAMVSAYLMKIANAQIEKESARHPFQLDDGALRRAVSKPNGIPTVIGRERQPLVEAMPAPFGTGQYPAPAPSPYGAGSVPHPASMPYPYGAGQTAPNPYDSGQYGQPPAVSGPYGSGQSGQPPQAAPNPYGADQSGRPWTPPEPSGAGQPVQPSPQAAPGPYDPDWYEQSRLPPQGYGAGQTAPSPYSPNTQEVPQEAPSNAQEVPEGSAPDPYAPDDDEEEE